VQDHLPELWHTVQGDEGTAVHAVQGGALLQEAMPPQRVAGPQGTLQALEGAIASFLKLAIVSDR